MSMEIELHKSFYQLRDEIDESINKSIPRVLRCVAESSGYSTLQVTTQAKAVFESYWRLQHEHGF